MKLVYIAGKFRGADAWEVEANTHRAREAGMKVAKIGHMPVVPHSPWWDRTVTDQFWLEGTALLMKQCDAVLLLDGWTQSEGAVGEVDLAHKSGIPIFRTAEDLAAWNGRVHALKVWTEFWEDIESGRKTFEIRKNDRGFQVRDALVLRRFEPDAQKYVGECISFIVKHVTHGGRFGLAEDHVCMSVQRVEYP